jgi:hypothetical protein
MRRAVSGHRPIPAQVIHQFKATQGLLQQLSLHQGLLPKVTVQAVVTVLRVHLRVTTVLTAPVQPITGVPGVLPLLHIGHLHQPLQVPEVPIRAHLPEAAVEPIITAAVILHLPGAVHPAVLAAQEATAEVPEEVQVARQDHHLHHQAEGK